MMPVSWRRLVSHAGWCIIRRRTSRSPIRAIWLLRTGISREAAVKLARAAHLVLGRRGEEAAVRLLLAKGYTILARNWRIRSGELDIVARDGRTLVFVEVKTRRRSGFYRPGDNLSLRADASEFPRRSVLLPGDREAAAARPFRPDRGHRLSAYDPEHRASLQLSSAAGTGRKAWTCVNC